MEIRLSSSGWCRRQESLVRGTKDHTDIAAGFRTKGNSRSQDIEWNGHRGHPCPIRCQVGPGLNTRHRHIDRLTPLARRNEFTAPPCGIRREIDFEIAPALRISQKKLGHVMFPEVRTKYPRA